MRKLISKINLFIKDERGDLVQQALIWVLVAIAAIGALSLVGADIVATPWGTNTSSEPARWPVGPKPSQ